MNFPNLARYDPPRPSAKPTYVHANSGGVWSPEARCGQKLDVIHCGVYPGKHCASNSPSLVTCPKCMSIQPGVFSE